MVVLQCSSGLEEADGRAAVYENLAPSGASRDAKDTTLISKHYQWSRESLWKRLGQQQYCMVSMEFLYSLLVVEVKLINLPYAAQ